MHKPRNYLRLELVVGALVGSGTIRVGFIEVVSITGTTVYVAASAGVGQPGSSNFSPQAMWVYIIPAVAFSESPGQ